MQMKRPQRLSQSSGRLVDVEKDKHAGMSRNGNQKMRWHWIVLIASMKTKLDMPEYAIGTKMGRYVLMMARVPVYAIVNDNYLGPLPDVRRSKREERSMMPVPSVYSCISDRGTCTSMVYSMCNMTLWVKG